VSLISVISIALLWVVALLLGFLLLGALRSIERLRWRMDQLEATMPSRVGRSGLRPGKNAPDFTLPCASGGVVSLHDCAGRKVLMVFTQTGCGPCGEIIPELNRLERDGVQVLVVNRGTLEETRQWAAATGARCPVLAQEGLDLARRYEVFATPFAFLVNEQGVIASKGIVSNRRHIQFVLSTAHEAAEEPPVESETSAAAEKG
jgi:methylamine dehydrogenase accessory protein MauD